LIKLGNPPNPELKRKVARCRRQWTRVRGVRWERGIDKRGILSLDLKQSAGLFRAGSLFSWSTKV
jgi:hypothetical protein